MNMQLWELEIYAMDRFRLSRDMGDKAGELAWLDVADAVTAVKKAMRADGYTDPGGRGMEVWVPALARMNPP